MYERGERLNSLIPMGKLCDERRLIEELNLPSHRWKKRRVQKGVDRLLHRQYREAEHITRLIRNLGYEPLEHPYQKGWKRMFQLREEWKLDSRAELYNDILQHINHTVYSPEPSFSGKRKRRRSRIRYEYWERQQLRALSQAAFERASFSAEAAALFERLERPCSYGNGTYVEYVFTQPWRFELKVLPHIITHVRRRDLELERRIDELWRLIDRDEGRKIKVLWGGISYSYKYWERRKVEKRKYSWSNLKNQPLARIIETYETEKHLWEYTRNN